MIVWIEQIVPFIPKWIYIRLQCPESRRLTHRKTLRRPVPLSPGLKNDSLWQRALAGVLLSRLFSAGIPHHRGCLGILDQIATYGCIGHMIPCFVVEFSAGTRPTQGKLEEKKMLMNPGNNIEKAALSTTHRKSQ